MPNLARISTALDRTTGGGQRANRSFT